MTIQASVYVICRNEAHHIGRLLESVKEFDEVILVDSGSIDDTLEIAKKFSNVAIHHQDWLGFASQKAFALNLCKNVWVLNLDADEELSEALKNTIQETLQLNNCDALSCYLSEVFMGKPAHRWSKHADKIRFFKKNHGSYKTDISVHESITIKGKISQAQGVIYHYGLSSIQMMIAKNNEYSSLAALDKFQKYKKANPFKMIGGFFWAFFRAYILKRFFLNGLGGFIHSMSIGFYAFLKEAKLYELHKAKRSAKNHLKS